MKKAAKRVVKSSKSGSRKVAAASEPAARTKKAPAARAKSSVKSVQATAPSPPLERPSVNSLESYSAAVEAFRSGEFERAKALFDLAAATTGSIELAHAARNYSRMCEARIGRQRVEPKTAEEFYTYGVALTNQRKLQEARANLEQAAKLSPQSDHIHYALALCLALSGDLQGAANAMRTAIQLNPGNRSLARNDPDFHEFARKRPLAEVLTGA